MQTLFIDSEDKGTKSGRSRLLESISVRPKGRVGFTGTSDGLIQKAPRTPRERKLDALKGLFDKYKNEYRVVVAFGQI